MKRHIDEWATIRSYTVFGSVQGSPSHAHVTIKRMKDRIAELPDQIAAEAGELIAELHSMGWTVHGSQYEPELFGNWLVDLQCGDCTLRLVRDRSQFMVDGPEMQQLKDAGLWRAFGSFEEFHDAVRRWALSE